MVRGKQMIQGLIEKKAVELIIKKIMEKREVKKLRKYVEQDNELDIQMRQVQKTVGKLGKYIEDLEKNVANLKRDSHPPRKDYDEIVRRLEKLEKRRK